MTGKSLIKKFALPDDELSRLTTEALGSTTLDELDNAIGKTVAELAPHKIVSGKVIKVQEDGTVIVDVSYKAEGQISIDEFPNPLEVQPGAEVECLVEAINDAEGYILLSKRKADRIRGWETIIQTHQEGDTVKGMALRKIKGGLLVDIGVPVFLPASQVNIRRAGDIGDWIGKDIEARIIKIDEERMNIVISRRKLIEEEREAKKEALLKELEEGQVRMGVVKNIAGFGVFVDLGGIDGLLHITDMSWGRVNHPSEMVKLDDEVEVKVLKIDHERERIALGMKQKTASPWDNIADKYPIGQRINGEVVNLMSYGAFVKLEDGVEGLVHISEMSWTKRVNHPNEVVSQGDQVEVVVLEIDTEKQTISLGMKQTEVNPWELVAEKYPPGTIIDGKVRNLANYGAFIEIEPGIDGLLHVSDISWTKKVAHPNEIFQKGETVRCVVIEVDQEKQRVGLRLKQLSEDPWIEAIPTAYRPGMIVKGHVTKITNFGVFVELEDNLEGLLHISELSDQKIENPQDVVKVGDEVDVKILRVDTDDRKIGLSLKRAQWGGNDTTDYSDNGGGFESPSPRRGGMDDHGAMGTDKIRF